MPRELRLNVQVDRLPNVSEKGVPWVQLGVRASATIVPATNDPAVDDDRDRVIPWLWRTLANDATPTWNPHDKKAWTLWRVPKNTQTPQLVNDADWDAGQTVLPDVSGFDAVSGPFRTRVDAEIQQILTEGGARQAFEQPDGTIVGRSVVGLVETLTSLPHPIPVGMKVWTVLSVNAQTGGVDDDDTFVAVPRFAVLGSSYEPASTLKQGSDLEQWTCAFQMTGTGIGAAAMIYQSKPLTELAPPSTNPERLLDPSRLLIRSRLDRQFEASDWATTLVDRVAPVVDPVLRILSVLDQVIEEVVSEEADAQKTETREELRKDLDPRSQDANADSFRRALNAVAKPVLATRALVTRGGMSPAITFLERLAVSQPDMAETALSLLLSHGAVEQLPLPNREVPPFQLVTRTRLLSAAQVQLEPRDVAEVEQGLDREEGLAKWMAGYWTGLPTITVAAGGKVDFVRFEETIVGKTDDIKTVASRRPIPAGIIDLAAVPHGEGRTIRLRLKLGEKGFPLAGTIAFRLDSPGREKRIGLDASLTCESTKTTLKVGGNEIGVGKPATHGILTLQFELPKTGRVSLLCEYDDEAWDPISTKVELTDLVSAGRLALHVDALNAGATLKIAIESGHLRLEGVQRILQDSRQVRSLRVAMSTAYARPLMPGLIGGFVPIDAHETAATHRTEPIEKRLPAIVEAYVKATFTTALKSGVTLSTVLERLFERVLSRAIDEAVLLAKSLVPPTLESVDRVTEDASALAFVIDQLQANVNGRDLWERLAGVGVLIARDEVDDWWSLNAATLHVTTTDKRADLVEGNAVRVKPGAIWQEHSRVDPVGMVVSESNDVRTALVSYDSHSIIGEVQNLGRVPGGGTTRGGRRRPEAFLFPHHSSFKLPPLTFGRTYRVVPYLVAYGAALPPLFRDPNRPRDPVTRRPPNTVSKGGEALHGQVTITTAELDKAIEGAWDPKVFTLIRSKPYLRTVPVAPPRISPTTVDWPGAFPGVDPLADELPIGLPPITLTSGAGSAPVRFFLDQQQVRGVLDGRDAARIEIGRVNAPRTPTGDLRVRVFSWPAGKDAPVEALTLDVPLATLEPLATNTDGVGVRIDVAGMTASVVALIPKDVERADDPPVPKTIAVSSTVAIAPVDWRSAFITIATSGSTCDVEPPMVHWASPGRQPADPITLEGDKPLLPPELAHLSRKVSMLDGIKVGRATGPRAATLVLRRPSVPFATYDRWVNGPLTNLQTGATESMKGEIGRAIGAAEARTKATNSGDQTLDDPAVEALFIEVVQRFPARSVCTITIKGREKDKDTTAKLAQLNAIDSAKSLAGLLGLDPKDRSVKSPDFATVVVEARLAASPGDPPELTIVNPGHAKLLLSPGAVYDVRIYGGVRANQPALHMASTAARFSPSARAGWRDAGGGWHLGAALSTTIEVASEVMPEILLENAPPFDVKLVRPPAATEDRAQIFFRPDNVSPPTLATTSPVDLKYLALRSVNRAAIIDQRWSWRGRPHPELESGANPHLGFDGARVEAPLSDFVSAAFAGRAHDDVGAIREVAMSRADVLASPAPPGLLKPAPPVLLEKDLDYRGGVNVWRLALRLRSRYAAMRPNDPALIRFSHRKKTDELPRWWSVVVPDRARPWRDARRADRPSLMLVLPLTEPLMAAGSVPPLLAIFNQELFPSFNAADGIETTIEVARHPFTLGDLRNGSNLPLRESHRELFAKITRAQDAYDRAETNVADAKRLGGSAADVSVATAELGRQQTVLEQLSAELSAVLAAHPSAAQIPLATFNQLASRAIKYWPEYSPDGIRSGLAASGRPLAIRTDGPVGYTFDVETEIGRFDHAALLISPVAEKVRPWSFVKLRFRRFESPELIVGPKVLPRPGASPKPGDPPHPNWDDDRLAREEITVTDTAGALVEMSSVSPEGPPRPAEGDDRLGFRAVYEGVAFDFVESEKQVRETDVWRGVKLTLHSKTPVADGGTTIWFRREIRNDETYLVVEGETALGRSGTWSVRLAPGTTVQVRTVVSQRPKPGGSEGYRPSGDVSVRVRLHRDHSEGMKILAENAWLSVLCMPLTIDLPPKETIPSDEQVFVNVAAAERKDERAKSALSHVLSVRPIRLSDFAPGVWCQFASIMSRLHVTATATKDAESRAIVDEVHVSQLRAQRLSTAQTLRLTLDGLRPGERLEKLHLRAEGDPSIGQEAAQVEEALFAVVTRYIYDAFDRQRERPIAIFTLPAADAKTADPEGVPLGECVWPAKGAAPFVAGDSGRVRFLRALRGRPRSAGGFEPVALDFPLGFFGDLDADAAADEPFDAAGLALGISEPVEWQTIDV